MEGMSDLTPTEYEELHRFTVGGVSSDADAERFEELLDKELAWHEHLALIGEAPGNDYSGRRARHAASLQAAEEKVRPAVRITCETCRPSGGNHPRSIGEVRRSAAGFVFAASWTIQSAMTDKQRDHLRDRFTRDGSRLPGTLVSSVSAVLLDAFQDGDDLPTTRCHRCETEFTMDPARLRIAAAQWDGRQPIYLFAQGIPR